MQVQPGFSRALLQSLTSVSSTTEMHWCLACAGVDKTLRMAVNMMTKSLLQYLELVVAEPDFAEMWARMLQVLQVGPHRAGMPAASRAFQELMRGKAQCMLPGCSATCCL